MNFVKEAAVVKSLVDRQILIAALIGSLQRELKRHGHDDTATDNDLIDRLTIEICIQLEHRIRAGATLSDAVHQLVTAGYHARLIDLQITHMENHA